jgi:tripartite-type tricarboxylate transporter receptor subunit TctC
MMVGGARLMRPVLFLLMCSLASVGAAQSVQQRPIRVVVGYPPGGSADVTARVVMDAAARFLAASVVIDNRPGAAGGIANETLARSAPDGHTLIVAPDSSLYQPVLNPALPFRAETHFAPITLLTLQPIVLAVHPAPGWKTVAELIGAAKKRPGELAYVLPGATSTQAVVAGLFFRAAGVKLASIPYKGGGQAIVDLVSGQVPVGVLGAAPLMPQARAGRVRLLAVTSRERVKSLPDVPTLAESGYPQIDIAQWFGALAPAGTAKETVARLAGALLKALADPAVVERLGNAGLEPVGGSSEEFARRIRAEIVTWSRAAKELGLRP